MDLQKYLDNILDSNQLSVGVEAFKDRTDIVTLIAMMDFMRKNNQPLFLLKYG